MSNLRKNTTPSVGSRRKWANGSTALKNGEESVIGSNGSPGSRGKEDDNGTDKPAANAGVPVGEPNTIGGDVSVESAGGALSDAEKRDFGRLLRRLGQLDGAWYEEAKIILELRDRRLYREDYTTFEEFCKKELAMTRANINRRIRSGEIAAYLETNVSKPAKESHIRPLLKLSDRTEQAGCYRAAVETAQKKKRPLRASDVTKAVGALLPTNHLPANVPDGKAAILTRMGRNLVRGLSKYSEDQLRRLEERVETAKRDWLEEPPLDPTTQKAEPGGQQ